MQGESQTAGAGTTPRSYRETRAEFRTGDVLCFRGRGASSAAIRWLTNSAYSHAGIVYLFEDRVYCLEATGVGVHLILMSELIKRYHGGIDYFRLEESAEEARRKVISFGFQQLGKVYDHKGIMRFLRFLLSGHKARSRERSQWYCSELVDEAFRVAGIPLVTRGRGYVSPADVARSPRLKFAFRVKPEA